MKTMLLALLGVLALTAVSGDEAVAKGTKRSAVLSGAEEVPGPGDPDGSGVAFLRLNSGQGRICFEIHVDDIFLPATAAHIHEGAAGDAGLDVVTLAAPDATGMSTGCVGGLPRALVKDIRKNPENYYINVHTSDFPAGAVRGQLSK